VTGGAGTLALVNARALLEHGLSGLALFDLDPSHASTEIAALRTDFPHATILTEQVNVTDAAQVQMAVDRVAQELRSIDVLICFAGVVGCQHAVEMTPDEWKRTLDVNTTGAFFCAQAVARYVLESARKRHIDWLLHGFTVLWLHAFTKLRSTSYPAAQTPLPEFLLTPPLSRLQISLHLPLSILLIASISAHRTNFPQPQAAYNASKAALLSLKASLAAEWAVHGIRVNTISPGYMDTILNEGEGLEVARRTWCERNPMGRMGVPEELTGPVVLLCSQAGSYVNGADLVVDGGQCCF